MKYALAFTLLTALLAGGSAAHALDKEAEMYFQRYDRLVTRLAEDNSALLKRLEENRRAIDDLKAANDALKKQLEVVTDNQQTALNDLDLNQQRLYENYATMNWGSEKRDCKGIGQHQQIGYARSADGTKTLRYLCFDGRALHLGTDLTVPPEVVE